MSRRLLALNVVLGIVSVALLAGTVRTLIVRGKAMHLVPAPSTQTSDSTNSTVVMTRAVRLADRSSPSRTGTTPISGSSSRAWRIHSP